jgi:hypothetical protein
MRQGSRLTVIAAIGLSIGLVVSGCGSSDESSPDDSGSEVQSSSPADSLSAEEEILTGSEEATQTDSLTNSPDDIDSTDGGSGEIQVDRGLLSVELTIPADFLNSGSNESQSEEELEASAREDGYDIDITLNADGSATYRMSRGDYGRLLDDTRASVDESIQEVLDSEPGVFESVTYSDDLREFDVVVDRQAFENSFAAMGIGFTLLFSGLFYQAFAGTSPEESYVIINTIDGSTGEVFETYDSREDENVSAG